MLGAITSLVCMGSMGAMSIAASAGSAATSGMAGMGTMGSTPPSHVAFMTSLFQSLGLSALTQIPDAVLRPVLIILLGVGIIGAYVRYRAHGKVWPFLLVVVATILLYTSIYVFPGDALYFFSLVLLLLGSLWNARVRSITSVA